MPEDTPQRQAPAGIDALFYMLATSAMINLGLVPNPVDKKTERNLQAAQHSIDLLGVLREKTRGNLSAEESKLLDDILYDLRMKYVKSLSPSDEKQTKGKTP